MVAGAPRVTRSDRPARRALRVVHVVRSLDTGGQEIILSRLIEALDRTRHACSVVALTGGGPLIERLRAASIPVHCLGARDGVAPALLPKLAALSYRLGADVVHAHNFQPFLYAGVASFLRPGARLVATAHGFRTWKGWRFPSVTRALFGRASAIVAVTPEMKAFLRERGVPERKLQVIVNGVDTDVFRPSGDREGARAALGVAPEERVIGSVGRLSPEKDPGNLVRAMEVVIAREPRARLLLVGDGPLRGELEALIRERGLGDRVRLLGERADVRAFLAAIDLFCLPSQTEGTSISLLEAMACALPIVATAVGGTPSVVEADEAAVLVPPGDPAALGGALAGVIGDPDGARRLGDRARAAVERGFSLRGMATAYARLYDEVTGR